jgi:HSP20 family protein
MSTQVEPVTIGRSRNPLMARRMGSWLSPMQSMENWLDDMESRWMPRPQGILGHRPPRVDIIERDEEICVKAEMPGVDKNNIEVNLDDDVLTIKSSFKKEEREESGHYLHCEIAQEEYQRTLALPMSAQTDKATASFKDGMLEVVIPKKPGHGAKKIDIQ